MTEKYQEFIMTNNDIKLSDPKGEEDFIHNVNSYLTQTMELNPQSSRKNKSVKNKAEKEDKSKNFNKHSLSSTNIFNNKGLSSCSNLSAKAQSKRDLSNKKNKFNIFIDKDILHNIKNSKNLSLKTNFNFSALKLDIPVFSNNLSKRKMTKSFSDILMTSKTINTKAMINKPKLKIKKRLHYTVFQIALM